MIGRHLGKGFLGKPRFRPAQSIGGINVARPLTFFLCRHLVPPPRPRTLRFFSGLPLGLCCCRSSGGRGGGRNAQREVMTQGVSSTVTMGRHSQGDCHGPDRLTMTGGGQSSTRKMEMTKEVWGGAQWSIYHLAQQGPPPAWPSWGWRVGLTPSFRT